MLPTHHQSEGQWDKWSVNNMSKVSLAVALVLLLSLQILTWNGNPLVVENPCPTAMMGNSTHLNPSLSSPSLDELPQLDAEVKQKKAELMQREAELKQREDELKRKEDELLVQQLKLTESDDSPLAQSQLPPNSYFPDTDSDIWGCSQDRIDDNLTMTYREWVTGGFSDEQALCAAHRHARRPMAPGTPRIAFLYMTRGAISTEPVWKKFFAGHEDKYSIYVHDVDPHHEFESGSLFHNRTIPSQPLDKRKIAFAEAVRRLLAYALLDSTTPNAWFHVLCESSVPIRSFPFVYDYITRSDRSFVEAFDRTKQWWKHNWVYPKGDMTIPMEFTRKGEAWIAVHRRHAGLIVGDHYVFPRFKHHWFEYGYASEIYIPTLLTLVDVHSIAHRSLVYVKWVDHPRGDSPNVFNAVNVTPAFIQGVQSFTSNVHGFYNYEKPRTEHSEKTCYYNGRPNSPCFLFARKFSHAPETMAKLLSLSSVLGYD